MRIRYLVPRCTPDNSHGRYVIELARRFASAHQVTVFSGRFGDAPESGIEHRHLPVPNRPTAIRLAAMWAFAQTLDHEADIVHVQGADAPPGNVATAHCCNAAMRKAAGADAGVVRRANYAVGSRLEKHCFTHGSTRVVIAVSNRVRDEIELEYGVERARVTVIPPGVDTQEFTPAPPEVRAQARKRIGLDNSEFVIAFVGGDYRTKGLVPLISAVSRLDRRFRVIAAGLTPDAELRAILQRTGCMESIRCLGVVKQMNSFYAAADCFVLPTRYDTFSLATLEAMASGLPVVVSRAAGVTELVANGRDALVLEEPADVEALVGVLRHLQNDTAFRRTLAEGAHRTAERHTWDEVARRTLVVYEGVIRDPNH